MMIQLDKEDLISLVMGQSPWYHLFEHPMVKKCGHFTGGHHNKWTWNEQQLKALEEKDLFKLYTLCKESGPK